MKQFKPTLILLICTILITGAFLPACSAQPSLEELDEWDLVWVSDSSGWGVAEVYAEMIEQDTGKTVNVYDNWIGGLPIGDVLNALKGEPTPSMTLEKLAEQFSEAEVIVIYGNPEASINPDHPGDWMCVSDFKPNFVNQCNPEIFEVYIDHLEQVYEIILELRDGKPTIIRAFDAYNPLYATWEADGVYDKCHECWGFYNAAIHQAASTYNIPVALVSQAWNGPNLDEDPNDKGYTSDGVHPSEAGAIAIAEALRELGYEPVVP